MSRKTHKTYRTLIIKHGCWKTISVNSLFCYFIENLFSAAEKIVKNESSFDTDLGRSGGFSYPGVAKERRDLQTDLKCPLC